MNTSIRRGEINCPMKGCTWRFFTAYELGYHLDGNCSYGSYKGDISCAHCDVDVPWEQLKVHITNTHRDVS